MTPADPRRVHRIVVDVLATDAQLPALFTVIGEALCDAPDLHDGPCRVAWTLASTREDNGEGSYGLDAGTVAFTRELLSPVEVWAPDDVDKSLGL